MKKSIKKLPILLAFAFTLFAASCSDIDVRPSGGGDDDDDTIVISPPPPPTQKSMPADSTMAIGG